MRRTAMMNCVEDATNESAMPVPLVPAASGYAGFIGETNKEKVPLVSGNEVLFHPNIQPFGCTIGNEFHAPLSQCPPTSHYGFMSSAQTYSPVGSSIHYNSLPGTSGIGHFGQSEVYGQPQRPQVTLDSAAAADRTRPALMVNQMLPEKLMGIPGDKQRLIRVLKENPRLMAEFIKKVRLQEALKQQQQQLMMPPGPGTAAQALSDGSVRYPMVPYPGQPIQQQGGMGVASGQTMMAANGDHHLLQAPHQSTRPSPQRMPLKYDRHQQPPGLTPCSQPYPGFNQECVRQLPFHQVVPHINPQLMNHSSVQQPQGSTMGLASYLLPPADKMLGPGALLLQMPPDCSSVACSLPSGGPLASSSPCPANNSLSPHHLPTHYKNQILPHSTDFGAVQRMGHVGQQQNVLCQDAMFARQLSFSPNAKTPEMANSTISRQTELTDSLQQQQQQQPFSGANSYLHFLDRK